MLWLLCSILLSTLVSEDLACISAGLLIRQGTLRPVPAMAACFLGIYIGDLLLFYIARVAALRLEQSPWLRRRITPASLAAARDRFERSAPVAILTSRFIPGMRLPLCLAAGALGRRSGTFLLWSFLAAVLWTPLIVLLAAHSSGWVVSGLGNSIAATAAAAALLYLLFRGIGRWFTPAGRALLVARIERLWRWEFWPAWLFYLPLVPHVALLSVRHRGLLAITAANPAIPHSGIVGESKTQILSLLDTSVVIPYVLIPSASVDARLGLLQETMRERNWSFPIILKPDASQRGVGVRLIHNTAGALKYLSSLPAPMIAQVYHPGPHEAGIFYARFPHQPTGQVLSITEKRFPLVIGDGMRTLRQLILADNRLRMQARTFFTRHAERLDTIPAPGECVRLAVAGNHCQGTMFLDGSHLLTRALEARIDQVARQIPGFYFGRFDVRYSDVEAFKAGLDLHVIELNGATSESTNLYDPRFSLLGAYRTLFHQWSTLFAIGHANLRAGHAPSRLWDIVRATLCHYRQRTAPLVSD